MAVHRQPEAAVGVAALGVSPLHQTVASAPAEESAWWTDEKLLGLVARGDESGLEALYDRYSRPVFSVLLRMVGDRQVAEELTQETFVRIWRQAGSFSQDRGRAASWVFAVAHHLGVDELRRRAARPRQAYRSPEVDHPSLDIADQAPGPENRAMDSLRRGYVAEAMAALPNAEREVLELAYFGGLTQSQIAEGRGEPLGSVKTRTRRGLERMRAHLEARVGRLDLP